MHKNINSGPRSWKSNQESYVASNSIIVDNFMRFSNPNIHQAIMTPKNTKPIHYPKITTIQRHYSEEDFKKHFNVQQAYYVEIPTKVQQEYFPGNNFPLLKPGKQVRSIEKNNKPKQNKQKSTFDAINIRNTGLKETSSTQSAQNLSRPIPVYVRNKFKNNQRPYEYVSKRLSTPRNNIRRQNFKIISKLGQGKFGKVFMVKEVYTGFILAMKIIEKKKITKQGLLQQFIRQLKIQTYLDHPNIISCYGFFSDQTHFYTLMELGCDGQLYNLIQSNKLLSEETTSFIVKNLLAAINYIHENKILHRDIKPENIVLIMGNVKICDFGWAVNKLHPGDLRNTFCGTPLYLSPEILQGNRYDEKVDLWAIGVLAYELYLGCNPFDINDHQDLLKIATQTLRFPQNRQISEQFKDFIRAMLTKNPSQRLTSKKLLQMQFIAKYKDFQTCEQLCR